MKEPKLESLNSCILWAGSTEPPPLPAKALHFTVSCLVLEEFSPSLFFLLLSDLPKTGIFIKILSPNDLVGINHFQIYHKEQAGGPPELGEFVSKRQKGTDHGQTWTDLDRQAWTDHASKEGQTMMIRGGEWVL